MRFTAEHYDTAIQALEAGKTQLEPDGDHCHICTDSGHQAWECSFNPLLAMALCAQIAQQSNDLHDTLHYLAGFESWMGERTGPAKIVTPEAQVEAEKLLRGETPTPQEAAR